MGRRKSITTSKPLKTGSLPEVCACVCCLRTEHVYHVNVLHVHCVAEARLVPQNKTLRPVLLFSPPWGVARGVTYDVALADAERQVHLRIVSRHSMHMRDFGWAHSV